MPENNRLRHILVQGHSENLPYSYPKPAGGGLTVKDRDRNIHGNRILRQIQELRDQFDVPVDTDIPESIIRDDVIYVEFESEWGHELKLESLEDNRSGKFLLLNIKEEERITESPEFKYRVTVMMTQGGVSSFISKVEKYLTENFNYRGEDTGNPKNQALINNIENIQRATIRSFWTDEPEIPFPSEDDSVWWEVWFRKTSNDQDKIGHVLHNLESIGAVSGQLQLSFPEHTVRLVKATANQLSRSLLLLDNLAELRRPQEINDFITRSDVDYHDRDAWIQDLVERTDSELSADSTMICLLDTGVTSQHPLLSPFISNERLYAYNPDWGVYDSAPGGGHGTGMAALALYGDLIEPIQSTGRIRIYHGLESFKIIENGVTHEPELYGALTEYACSTPIADRPDVPRVFCLAVCDKDFAFKGRPSAWSAAIDKIAFGSNLEPISPQLVIVSGGNVEIERAGQYPDRNLRESIHDPGQAYNAITVGAYTRKDRIDATQYPGWSVMAPNGGLSPSSSTSVEWEHQWPLKPDIVMEGGNMAENQNMADYIDSLQLLTANKDFRVRMIQTFGDTSASAALASKFAAELRATYPDYWPETIRGLMIHSAEWTPAMLDGKDITRENDRKTLLRTYGYGVPILEKAIHSASNSLTLIAEKQTRPYRQDQSNIKYNEYQLFELPWPVDVLQNDVFDSLVTLKVTLSYYIEPNPGERRYSKNFQYHSHALEFAVIKPSESLAAFKRRISAEAANEQDVYEGADEPWNIKRVRSRGSVRKDYYTMTGAEVARRNIIAVYPMNGWYRTRKKLAKWNSEVRYSLIVSLETDALNVDLYTPVMNQIETWVAI